MKWLAPYRLASYLLVFFAITHTVGGLYAPHDYGDAAEAVFRGMKEVHFVALGSRATWHQFYMGFGLLGTVFLATSALYAWQLASLGPEQRRAMPLFIGAFLAGQVVNMVLCWEYFFLPPAVTATLISALVAWQTARDFGVGARAN